MMIDQKWISTFACSFRWPRPRYVRVRIICQWVVHRFFDFWLSGWRSIHIEFRKYIRLLVSPHNSGTYVYQKCITCHFCYSLTPKMPCVWHWCLLNNKCICTKFSRDYNPRITLPFTTLVWIFNGWNELVLSHLFCHMIKRPIINFRKYQ